MLVTFERNYGSFIFQVLFLVDPMDEIAIQHLKSYKEKNFVDISKEDLDLGNQISLWWPNMMFDIVMAKNYQN